MAAVSILPADSQEKWGLDIWINDGERMVRSLNVQLLGKKENNSGDGKSDAKVENGKEQKHSADPLVLSPTEAPEVKAEETEGERDGNKYHRPTGLVPIRKHGWTRSKLPNWKRGVCRGGKKIKALGPS